MSDGVNARWTSEICNRSETLSRDDGTPRAVHPLIMKLAAVAALALLALPATASAGGYVSAGLGTGARFTGSLSGNFTGEGHNSGKVMIGKRFGIVSIEAGVAGFGIDGNLGTTGDLAGDRLYSASASVVGQFPVMPKLEVFARLGLSKAWVSGEGDDRQISGGGYVTGVGASYDLGFRDAALWAEIGHEVTRLERAQLADMKGGVDTLMIGVRFGIGR